MIRNFTAAEWSALANAVSLLEADLEQNPESYTGIRPSAAAQRAALDRAYTKARQLAPDEALLRRTTTGTGR